MLLQVVRRAADAQGQRLLQDLVIPQGLVVRVEQDVRVQVDEAREQGHARQVDRRGLPRATLTSPAWPDRLDPIAADDDGPAVVRLGVDPVEHPRRLEHDRPSRGGAGPRPTPAPPGLALRRADPTRVDRHTKNTNVITRRDMIAPGILPARPCVQARSARMRFEHHASPGGRMPGSPGCSQSVFAMGCPSPSRSGQRARKTHHIPSFISTTG